MKSIKQAAVHHVPGIRDAWTGEGIGWTSRRSSGAAAATGILGSHCWGTEGLLV